MMEQTAEEAKSYYVEKMGEELGTQFHALWKEVAWLHVKWREGVELFGSKPTRIELLNVAAPTFFWMVENVLWEDMLLHISRLTDPPASGKDKGKENLTIRNLPCLVNDRAIKADLHKLVNTAGEKVKSIRDWRNHRIAHYNLDLAINKEASQLEPSSRNQVNEALRAIVNVLNAVDVQYTGSESHFLIPTRQGAVQLLHVLDAGVKKQQEWEERIGQGDWATEDYPHDL